jgi:hypothetical protein
MTSDYGQGCGGDAADSVYEEFTNANFDLAQRSYTWLRTGAGYTLIQQPVAFVTPSAGATNVATGQLDGQQSFTLSAAMPVAGGTTTSVNITTKGQIELSGVPGTIDFSPSAAELLNWPNTAFHCWHDYDQTSLGSGLIKYEEVAGIAYATWDGVHSFSSPQPSTFQWQLELATGHVSLVILGTAGISSAVGDLAVVGYSVGGTTVAVSPTDFSAIAGAVVVSDAQTALGPLAMTATGAPVLGSTTFSYSVTNVPSVVPFAFQFFGTLQFNPGIDLTGIGMPGCASYTSADLASLSAPAAAGTAIIPLAIPASPSLAGLQLYSQAVAFSLVTPLNLIASNGNMASLGF